MFSFSFYYKLYSNLLRCSGSLCTIPKVWSMRILQKRYLKCDRFAFVVRHSILLVIKTCMSNRRSSRWSTVNTPRLRRRRKHWLQHDALLIWQGQVDLCRHSLSRLYLKQMVRYKIETRMYLLVGQGRYIVPMMSTFNIFITPTHRPPRSIWHHHRVPRPQITL